MGLESYKSNIRKFSPLEVEIELVRKQAKEFDRDPEKAVETFLEKIKLANAHLAEDQKDSHDSGPRYKLN